MVEANGTTLTMYQLAPGTRYPLHRHPSAELGVILHGEGRGLFESEERVLRAGDSFYVHPNAPHGFVAGDSEPVIMLNVTVALPGDAIALPAQSVRDITARELGTEVAGLPGA